MRLLLITDTFPPLNNSGAVQLWDLAKGFKESGHDLTVMVASPYIDSFYLEEEINGIKLARIKTLKLKDINYLMRGLAELFMPFIMMKGYRQSKIANESWDGIIWYSPSIFFGPLISYIKKELLVIHI